LRSDARQPRCLRGRAAPSADLVRPQAMGIHSHLRRLATLLEEIPRADVNRYFMRMDGNRIILDDSGKTGRFERIMVRGSDLTVALRLIKAFADSFKQEKAAS